MTGGGTAGGPASPGASRLDVRLVPATLAGWAVTSAGIAWPVGAALACLCLATAALAGATRWWAVRRGRVDVRVFATAAAAAAIVGVGFGCAIALRANQIEYHPIAARFGGGAEVTVVAADSPRPIAGGRLMFLATLREVGGTAMGGRVVVFASAAGFTDLTAGQQIRFAAGIARPTRRDLTVAVLNAKGRPALGPESTMQRLARTVRADFAATTRQVLPAEQAAMLPALVLGDTSAVTGTTETAFRTAGLTHLTAVSGANVAIVCGAVLLSAVLVGPRVAVVLAGGALLALVVVVQPSASVLRAAVMGGIGLLAILSARRRQALPALCATVLGLIVLAPQLALDAGFALSVSATAALIVIAPIWSARLTARGWPKPLADAVAVAAAAQLVTAPLVAGISGRFSLVAIVANLLVAVVIPPITVIGTAAAALGAVWPAATGMLIRFTGPELWWLLTVAHWAGGVPGATVAVPSGAVGVVLLAVGAVLAWVGTVLLWRRRWFRWVIAGAGLVVVAALLAATIAGDTA